MGYNTGERRSRSPSGGPSSALCGGVDVMRKGGRHGCNSPTRGRPGPSYGDRGSYDDHLQARQAAGAAGLRRCGFSDQPRDRLDSQCWGRGRYRGLVGDRRYLPHVWVGARIQHRAAVHHRQRRVCCRRRRDGLHDDDRHGSGGAARMVVLHEPVLGRYDVHILDHDRIEDIRRTRPEGQAVRRTGARGARNRGYRRRLPLGGALHHRRRHCREWRSGARYRADGAVPYSVVRAGRSRGAECAQAGRTGAQRRDPHHRGCRAVPGHGAGGRCYRVFCGARSVSCRLHLGGNRARP